MYINLLFIEFTLKKKMDDNIETINFAQQNNKR